MKLNVALVVVLTSAFISLTSIPISAQSIKLPETGQKTCYSCEYEIPGDDGDLQEGLTWPSPRFVDNGDGTVTDMLTKLVWLKNADCSGQVNWYNALIFCNSLATGMCGLNDGSRVGDWRLPNRNELLSLIDVSKYHPALPDGHSFTMVGVEHFWTSTTSLYNFPASAWYLNIELGDVNPYENKNNIVNKYGWAVRYIGKGKK